MQEQKFSSTSDISGPFGYFRYLSGRLKLLVILPLAVGLVALLVALAWPKSYRSTALLLIPTDTGMTPHQVAAMLRAEPILRAMNPSVDPEASARVVSTRVGRDGMVRVEVSGPTPHQAQQSAQALLDAWLRSTAPGQVERADLLARRERALTDYKNIQAGIEALTRSLGSRELAPTEGLLRLAALSETADRLFGTIQITSRRLDGISRDVIRQAPSLPVVPRRPPAAAIGAAAAAIALFGLLLILLLQHRYRALRSAMDLGNDARDDARHHAG